MAKNKTSQFVEAFADFAINRKFLLFAALVVLTVVSATGMKRLEVQTTFRIWHRDDAPEILRYDKMTAAFGSDDTAVVAYQDPRGVLSNESLESIIRLTQSSWGIKSVKRVDSLANFPLIKASRPSDESPALLVSRGYVLAAADDGEFKAWDTKSWVERRFIGHEGTVEQLVADPQRAVVYSGSLDRTVKAWDLLTGQMLTTYHGAPEGLSSLLVSDDGRYVVAGSYKEVVVWESSTGKRLHRLQGHSDYVTGLGSVGGKLLSASREVFVWDLGTGKKEAEWNDHPAFLTTLVRARSGKALLGAFEDGSVFQWDMEGSPQQKSVLSAGSSAALSLANSLDGAQLYVGMASGSISRIDLKSSQATRLEAHKGWVMDLQVGPQGDLVSASQDRSTLVIDGAQFQQQQSLKAHRGMVRRVLVGDDGMLFSSGDDGAVYVWAAQADGRLGGSMVARLERRRGDKFEPVPPANGPLDGKLVFTNGFAHEVELRVSGKAYGKVAPGANLEVSNLPVGPRSTCNGDADCGTGQSCDFEESPPVCITPVLVEAVLPASGFQAISSKRTLVAGQSLSVRLPAEDAFSVQDVALQRLPAESLVGEFLKAFADDKVKSALREALGQEVLDDPAATITPSAAINAAEALAGSEGVAGQAATALEQMGRRVFASNRLPIIPHRLRETRYALTRGPVPPGLGAVLNEAGDTTMVLVSMHQEDHEKALARMVDLRSDLEKLVASEKELTGLHYYLTGDVISDTSFKEYAEKDSQRLVPLFLGIMSFVLIFMFRRLSGLLLPLVTLIVSLIITMGLCGYLGATINNMTSTVPQVVLAVSVANAIHLFTVYTLHLQRGDSPREASRTSVIKNLIPCFLTSFTTVIGFASLMPSSIRPVASFGWMAAVGMTVSFMVSFLLIPGVLAMLPKPRRLRVLSESGGESMTVRAFGSMANLVNRTAKPILAVFAVLTVVSIYGILGLTFDTNPIRNFKQGSLFRDSSDFIEKTISGPVGVELVVETNEPLGTRKVKYLKAMERLVAHIRENPQVRNVTSLPDIHKAMNRVFNGDSDDQFKIPDTDEQSSAAYTTYSLSLPAGLDLTNRVDEDESATRISIRMSSTSSGWMLDWERSLLEWAQKEVPELKLSVTGKFMIWATMSRELTEGFVLNVGSAVLFISACMFLIMRSMRLGALSIIPNLLPSLLTVGVVSLLGVPMDVSILVAICVALGIAVDDTIHLLVKYKYYLDNYPEQTIDERLVSVFKEVGMGITFSSLLLCVGFAVFMWTDFQINANFGLACAVMLLVALVLDLTLTPALLKLFGEPPAKAPRSGGSNVSSVGAGSPAEAGAVSSRTGTSAN